MAWVFACVLGWGCASEAPRADGASCRLDEDCLSDFCVGLCVDPEGDADADGLSNARERTLGLNPFATDTDGDGFADGLEFATDSDGDGKSDAIESAFSDVDGDCIVDSLDADDTVGNKDLRVLAAVMCRNKGLCSGAIRPTASCTAGQLTCDYSALAAWEGEVERTCDGLDNDCDGETDEHFVYIDSIFAVAAIGDACFGVGDCAEDAGMVHCDAAGRAALCSVNAGGSRFAGEIFDVDCDGIDNDCDGDTDEEIVWLDPLDGALLTAGSLCRAGGACGLTFGVVECAPSGETGLCSTGPGGTADRSRSEACNGVDDDCDGAIDEDLALEMGPGERIPLGGRCGLGTCDGGQVLCAGDGSAQCSTDSRKTNEVCNGLDDDCDGDVDELADVRQACPTVGVCGQSSLLSGRCDGAGLVCRYDDGTAWHSGQREGRCDQRDDDCDGLTDEDFATTAGLPAGAACVGVGACAGALGVVVCGEGGLTAACSANATGTLEVCDGLDNSCDGETDGGPLSDADACVGVGVCGPQGGGLGACEGGQWRCAWESRAEFQRDGETRCDGLDNDCDGWTDEGLRGQVTGASVVIAAAALSPGPNTQLALGPNRTPWLWAADPDGGGLFWRWTGDKFEPVWATGGPRIVAGQAVAWDETIGRWWVHGGGMTASDLWLFDPAAGTWLLTAAPSDAIRVGHVLVPLGAGYVLAHGGTDATTGLAAPTALWRYQARAGSVSVSAEVVPAGFLDAPALGWHRATIAAHDGKTWLAMVGPPAIAATMESAVVVGALWPLTTDPDSGRLVPLGPARVLRAMSGQIPRRPALWLIPGATGPSVSVLGVDAALRWAGEGATATVTPYGRTICASDALASRAEGGDSVRLTFGRCPDGATRRWAGESLTIAETDADSLQSARAKAWRQPVTSNGLALRSAHEDAVLALEPGVADVLWRWAGAGWDRWSLAPPTSGPSPAFATTGQFLARGGVEDGWWYAGLDGGALALWTLIPTGPMAAEWTYVARSAAAPSFVAGDLAGIGLTAGGEPWYSVAAIDSAGGRTITLVGWDGVDWVEVTGISGALVGGYADGANLRVVTVASEAPTWTLWGADAATAANATARSLAVGASPVGDGPSGLGVGVASQQAVFAPSRGGRMLRWSTGNAATVAASGALDGGVAFAESWVWTEVAGLLSTNSRGRPSLVSWPTRCAITP